MTPKSMAASDPAACRISPTGCFVVPQIHPTQKFKVQHGAALGHAAHKDEGHGLALAECHAVHAHHPQVLLLELHGPPAAPWAPAPLALQRLLPQLDCHHRDHPKPAAGSALCHDRHMLGLGRGHRPAAACRDFPLEPVGRTGGVLISSHMCLSRFLSTIY